jgi:hypothetical protein
MTKDNLGTHSISMKAYILTMRDVRHKSKYQEIRGVGIRARITNIFSSIFLGLCLRILETK